MLTTPESSQLQKGAFGVVKLAKFKGRLVAVKALKLNSENSNNNGKGSGGGSAFDQLRSIQLFAAEAAKMSQISHPRVVEFLGFVLESFSIVMEYMSHGTLADYLKQNIQTKTGNVHFLSSMINLHKNLKQTINDTHTITIVIPWSVRYWFIADIAEGMTYLHSKQGLNGKSKVEVFHQDLKPANILLNMENGVLRGKISDLGLAAIKTGVVGGKDGDLKPRQLLTSFVAHQGGTYAYMAPELLRGSTKVNQRNGYAYTHCFVLNSFFILLVYKGL